MLKFDTVTICAPITYLATVVRTNCALVNVDIPNLLDNKEVFLHACATVAFALRAVADAVRTRTEKLPYYRVHSVSIPYWTPVIRPRTAS
jgi:hypothetical protein